MTTLTVAGLRAGYGKIQVLHELSLTVRSTDYVAVVGANGAGKTTLLKSISGTVTVLGGRIELDGVDLCSLAAHKITALGIAHVPEGRQLFPHLTVLDNLMTGAWLRRDRAQRQETVDQVYALFPRLKERSAQLAGTLSGGEQQMVAVGRALMLGPKLIMLDEPSQGLAPKLVGEMYEQLAVVHAAGTGILLVEQNTTAALKYAEHVHVMEHGRISISGPCAELRGSDEIRKAYLGI